ncbi:MAG: DUF2214 family protein [Brachymonas sp.]
MWWEIALAYAHLALILSLAVFQGSLAALLRPEWMNPAALARLQRLVRINQIATTLVLASGLLRLFLGQKSAAGYMANPMMHAKLTLVLLLIALAIPCYRAVAQWQKTYAAHATLPDAQALKKARRWIMFSSHLMLLIPIFALLIARGYSSFAALGA